MGMGKLLKECFTFSCNKIDGGCEITLYSHPYALYIVVSLIIIGRVFILFTASVGYENFKLGVSLSLIFGVIAQGAQVDLEVKGKTTKEWVTTIATVFILTLIAASLLFFVLFLLSKYHS